MQSLRALALLVLVSGVTGQLAEAGGHFRYATMYWAKTSDPLHNTVEITVESAWRRSYSATYFTEAFENGGTVLKINGKDSPVVMFGDGKSQFLDEVKVVAFSEEEDWVLGNQTFTHTYATPNNRGDPWMVSFKGCCRVAGIVNNPDDGMTDMGDPSWNMTTKIDLLEATQSLRIVSLPVVHWDAMSAELQSFELLPSGFPHGTRLKWRQTTAFMVPQGPVIDNDGKVTATIAGQNRLEESEPQRSRGASCASLPCSYLLSFQAVVYMDAPNAKIESPVDLLINVSAARRTGSNNDRPAFPDLSEDLFMMTHAARPGFKFTTPSGLHGTTRDQQYTPAMRLGFTVGVLPRGFKVSTVRSVDSTTSAIDLSWTPCMAQLGMHAACFDVVDGELGIAATQQCLKFDVKPDEPPTISMVQEWNSQVLQHESMTQVLYIGKRYTFHVKAMDTNPEDELMIEPVLEGPCTSGNCPLTPPGSELGMPEVTRDSSSVTVTRELVYSPRHDHGGYFVKHCFQVKDSCGMARSDLQPCSDMCPGVEDMAVTCVTFRVKRCEFVVRTGQHLQHIASIYRTDWLQLWSHNSEITHPDLLIDPNSLLLIGRVYDVQPFDTPRAVAQRLGMSEELFLVLNADHTMEDLDQPLCTTMQDCLEGDDGHYQWCILPSSCEGDVSSIYTDEPPQIPGAPALPPADQGGDGAEAK